MDPTGKVLKEVAYQLLNEIDEEIERQPDPEGRAQIGKKVDGLLQKNLTSLKKLWVANGNDSSAFDKVAAEIHQEINNNPQNVSLVDLCYVLAGVAN